MDIKQLRDKLGVSQTKLSIMIGVTSQTVSNWENGISKPTKKHWAKLNKLVK